MHIEVTKDRDCSINKNKIMPLMKCSGSDVARSSIGLQVCVCREVVARDHNSSISLVNQSYQAWFGQRPITSPVIPVYLF